ncbi:MAG: PAS domain-containing protein, partial [Candidatus Thorarchaeota archaeon]
MSELPWTSTLQVNRLYDLLDEGFVVIDNLGVIVHSNKVFADSLNYAPGELVDRRFVELIPDEQQRDFMLQLADPNNQPLQMDLHIPNGNSRNVFVKSLRLTEGETPRGFCLIVTDRKEQGPEFKQIISCAYLKMVT